jgi:hypothetical protein
VAARAERRERRQDRPLRGGLREGRADGDVDTPNTCPVDPDASQAPDCGTQGPFQVQMPLTYKTGELGLDGILTRRPAPVFGTCEYEGLHELDLAEGFARLPARRLLKRRTLEVHILERAEEELADVSLRRKRR